jgi:hypothetical protein
VPTSWRSDLGATTVLTGHGDPWTGGAAEAVRLAPRRDVVKADASAAPPAGRPRDMDADREVHRAEHELDDEAAAMERRLDELGEHVDEAAKQARATRSAADPDEDAFEAVAGDASDRITASDDPASAVGNPVDES